MFDNDLTRIRKQYPQLADIHAVSEAPAEDIILTVVRGSPLWANWEKGLLATGESELDQVLSTYGVAGVRCSNPNPKNKFVVAFDASLNIRGLVSLFQSASNNILIAEPNTFFGDGNKITFEQGINQKKYVFSQGWGDCPSGCIGRHLWTVTIASDGSLTLQESGNPIPPGGAPRG
jgi:hypothetical protein